MNEELNVLKTDRLILKKITAEDYSELFKIWNDKELIKFTNHPYIETIEESKSAIIKTIDWYENSKSSFGPFLIYYNDNFIGYCGLDLKSENIKEYELFYIMIRNFWNKGFATEISKKLINIGFKYLSAERIMAEAVPENTGSWKLLEKIGMKREGCLRKISFIRSCPK